MALLTLSGTSGSLKLNASRVQFIRRLALPAVVLARADTKFDGSVERWCEDNLAAGPVVLSIDGVPLPAPARLYGPRGITPNTRGGFDLQAEVTAHDPALHLPRRRVHRPNDLLEHVEALKAVVVPSAVAKWLKPIKLGGPARAAIIQTTSDWAALGVALAECARLGPDAAGRDLTVTGGTAPGTAGKWVLTWRDPEAYRTHDDVAARTIAFEDGDGIAGPWGEPLTPRPGGPGTPLIGCVARLYRTLDVAKWKDETTKDVPLFFGKQFVVGVIDELQWVGGKPAWHTALEVAHTGVGLPGPFDGSTTRAWNGKARVLADTGTSQFVEVELPGFENGSNRLFAQRGTPTDGQGDGGENRKVYADAIAQIEHSGGFDDEAIFDTVRRRKPAEAPNTTDLDDITIRLGDVSVRECGDVNFDGGLTVRAVKDVFIRGKRAVLSSSGARVEVNENDVDTVQ